MIIPIFNRKTVVTSMELNIVSNISDVLKEVLVQNVIVLHEILETIVIT
uniref:CSON004881 protein n=1 Tax=Culicoides sonorensis TaxID=179676 RepID=A0A336MU88_CULSO